MAEPYYKIKEPHEFLSYYLNAYKSEYRQQRALKIIQLFPNLNGKKVLDLGCGGGFYSGAACKKNCNDIVCLDISSVRVKAAMLNLRKNGHLKIEGIVADATALPFRENCFDFIMCIDVIEHVKEDFKLLFEARRVLGNHGNFVVATQNCRSLNYIIEVPLQRYIIGNRRWMGWDSTHLRFYTPKSLVSLLMNSGFSVIKVAGTYFVPYMLATRIEFIYLLMKLMNKVCEEATNAWWKIFGWGIIILAEKGS